MASRSEAGFADGLIGAGGFEPPASGSQSQRSNQAELHPELGEA
jgi:hypothetical protein